MVKENSRLFAYIALLITGFLLIYYYVLSFNYRKRCTVFNTVLEALAVEHLSKLGQILPVFDENTLL